MKWIKRVFIGVVILNAVLLAVGWSSQAFLSRYEAKKYSMPGQLVDVGGYKLHINCSGNGSPDPPPLISAI